SPFASEDLGTGLDFANKNPPVRSGIERAAMAAAPAQVLPPAKRWKKDPNFLETSPVHPANAVTADWPSLPPDIVRHIADSFLATNDLDWYVDLRAVCHNWRSATDDPKDSTSDPRFLLRRWIILDEVFQSDMRRLLVNTATGRFLHKELHALRDYHVVATTLCGLFVLADRSPPHAARVFNPLTGDIIRFAAPVPPEVQVTAAVCFDFSSPLLALFFDSCCKMHIASPHSSDAQVYDFDPSVYSFFRRAVGGGLVGRWWEFAGTTDLALKICKVGQSLGVNLSKFFSGDPTEIGLANDARCLPMEFVGQMLIIIKGQQFFHVLRFKTESAELLHVETICNHAIFIGRHRCLAVDAHMFPSIETNCIYYTEHQGSSAHIWKYNIKDRKADRISEAVDFVKQDKQFVLIGDRPSTIIQLLSSYTISTRDSEMAGAVKLDD
uniref:KIB1-4 beta-propeller domain-containing protein n=1 Tax=Aegilops tauschii subsp. strangulata TaxID=200361 RepID=A0A453GJF4_AEGTS